MPIALPRNIAAPLRKMGPMNVGLMGAGLGAAKGLMTDPAEGESRLGNIASGALTGGALGAGAGFLGKKYLVPQIRNAKAPAVGRKTKKAELEISQAKFASIVADLNAGRAPEGAKPVIHEIIKRAQAAGIEPTAEIVAFNLMKFANRKLAAYEGQTEDDLHHRLPGGLDARAPKSVAKPMEKKKKAEWIPTLAAKG